MIVKPETLIGWHRKGFKLWWRWKSRFGRPRIPENLRQLIVRLVQENPTWGEERIAAELAVKLGILVSPRTVRAYWPQDIDPRGCRRTSSQHWRTFVRNHAKAIVAADFLVAITASFRMLYVFVVMEVGSRRILHCNITPHPTAAWTLQQFREAIASDHSYRFLIHDRDSIFSTEVDEELQAFGLKVLRTPVQAPKANAYCERLVGTIRRECLDYVIPLSEKHLRTILREWVAHYNCASYCPPRYVVENSKPFCCDVGIAGSRLLRRTRSTNLAAAFGLQCTLINDPGTVGQRMLGLNLAAFHSKTQCSATHAQGGGCFGEIHPAFRPAPCDGVTRNFVMTS